MCLFTTRFLTCLASVQQLTGHISDEMMGLFFFGVYR